ncbi:KN motif and ankyrin repeat domain-containing protein 1-like [Limanda limanda]|uniref:KN motif and ankyrin repeat domain-containing protein 1-like n=1 Tax=Limanda limanda TaxID=27771 RepID=UPI0029C85FC2|nr:KN motif and ankyrin repeat domain-containing protein 1-like [Limanda limanda]
MDQSRYILKTVSGQSTEECIPNYFGIEYIHQSNVRNLKFVDSFQNCTIIKRLSLKRRPRAAVNNAEKTQSGVSSSQWYSEESFTSSSTDDARQLGLSATTRGRPPLPPPHGSSLDTKLTRNEGIEKPGILTESKPQPTVRSIKRPVMETLKHLEQEVTSQPPPQPPPQPQPRRRLASFGGVSSPGSLSPFTGLVAYNQNNSGNKSTGTESDLNVHLSSSLGTRGSTGSLKFSPQSSGRTTPVPSPGSMHLQHVRDQMVVALQRLKELEEQVKIVPILQVKISVLQEEKRQLVSQLKNQSDDEDMNDGIWRRADSMERSDIENKVHTKEGHTVQSDPINLSEFRKLTKEMQALERSLKGGNVQARLVQGYTSAHENTVLVGIDEDVTLPKPLKENKCVSTNQVETRSIATEVSEVNLGIYSVREAELDAQQLLIDALKERISYLEADLKESALQTEMSRLKLELQAAGARSRADKACLAKPSTVSTGIEARPHTTSQGVGNHTEVRDTSTGEITEVKSVGVSCCGPELRSVCTGPDEPMSRWEVRERVETEEKGVGIQVLTNTQGVLTEIKMCDAETNTEPPMEIVGLKKGKTQYRSVACGDCSVDVIICEPKELVSEGMATDPIRRAELGIMASPLTASQRTNTVSSSESRFTNTGHTFSTDSSTNTLLSTQDKHTNTTQTVTRAVSVGNGVTDIKSTPETRTIGVGTATLVGNALKMTRDTGVGFTNINENFLIGLKTRNMASGPSHLPDPFKTRSIGVGEGRIQDFSSSRNTPAQSFQQSSQSQWDPELNHYIEKMQKLLGEHGNLLTEDCSNQYSGRGNDSSRWSGNNKAEVHHFDSQPPVSREYQSPFQLSVQSSKCEKTIPETCQQSGNESEVKRMIQLLEQQASSALQDRSANPGVQRPVIKKQNGEPGCSSNRRSMKFMRVTAGLDPMPSYELPVSEKGNSEEGDKRGNKKLREPFQGVTQARKGKGGYNKGVKTSKPHTQQRCKLSEKIFFACQALKMHLSDDTALPSRELHNCLQTLQQEWFSTSSHKSAAPDAVADYLSAFRVISPAVLQHIANMVDGNGNTALHYSVSHSNFGIVKRLLDAEVCYVNQQNKAGYTPIMLAALAAVETAEDMRVVEQLFTKGDVNAKASQAGQTALMLAVSHGRMGVVQALLAQGAEVNLQDDEGSTALMCASEHGHADIVKLLLAQAGCNATLTDGDESTALSIALEAGHHDIAVLLYAHANFSRGQAGAAAHHSGKSLSSPGGRHHFE